MSTPGQMSFVEYAGVLYRMRGLDQEVADAEREVQTHRASMEEIVARFGYIRNPDDPDDDPVARFRAEHMT